MLLTGDAEWGVRRQDQWALLHKFRYIMDSLKKESHASL